DTLIIRRIAGHVTAIVSKVDEMLAARKIANRLAGERAKALAYHDTIVPLMEEIRKHVDELEMIVDDEMWTLPKYRELLFIR
ncbi:MAG: glutamine synthetase type III, partial [Sphingobacteriia bacterium]|nr:glutamine synthetase type III [Sphingobacteriia bacterium]